MGPFLVSGEGTEGDLVLKHRERNVPDFDFEILPSRFGFHFW